MSALRVAAFGSRSTAAPASSPSSTSNQCNQSAQSPIDPKNPKVIWVGSGEAWTRNSTSVGDGVYKSIDGGDNWTNLGLKNSERIAKILIDPTSTDTVYVCTPGKLWSDSDDRGVYKTTDGGKTWTMILKGANASTGCSMMSMDKSNPQTIYAGMWDFRRKGWTFRSGGDSPNAPSGSGLFKSTDGGATWKELDPNSAAGLPAKPWGRIAVAVAPSKPNVVYVFIEAEAPKGGLYRSDDGGMSWTAADRSANMVWRPFYFANLIVDPKDEIKSTSLMDHSLPATMAARALVTSRRRTRRLSRCLDRSKRYRSLDSRATMAASGTRTTAAIAGGKQTTCRFRSSITSASTWTCQFHVYGGLQDNSSWVGDSRTPAALPAAGGKTCTAATASGCLRTLRIQITSTLNIRAAKFRASTARRTSRATSNRCPSTRKASSATTGIRPFM